VLDRFPELKVIITHGGGATPYLLGRLLEGPLHRSDVQVKSRYPFDHYLRRFYYDSCTYHPTSLQYLASLVGYDNIVFGTNAPGSPDLAPTLIDQLPGLTEAARSKLLFENAQRLFGPQD
ncbi:MAG: amidohydrolase family protein, partial [Chloroflexota bacterium]